MAVINMNKGERIDLTKNRSTLNKIRVGMGWSKKGFGSIDLDTSAILVKDNDTIKETISFHTRKSSDGLRYSSCKSVIHHGDDLTGGGSASAPNEVIDVILNSVAEDVSTIYIIMNTYSSGFKFKDLKNAWINIVDVNSNDEISRFTLSDDKEISDKKALFIGSIYKKNGEWKFHSLGQATNHNSISQMEKAITNGDLTHGSPVVQSTESSEPQNDGLMGRVRGFFS